MELVQACVRRLGLASSIDLAYSINRAAACFIYFSRGEAQAYLLVNEIVTIRASIRSMVMERDLRASSSEGLWST
jgi:hypothetical protein